MRINNEHDQTGISYHTLMGALKVKVKLKGALQLLVEGAFCRVL